MIADDHTHVLCEDCQGHCIICGAEAPPGLYDAALMAEFDQHPSLLFAAMSAACFSVGMRERNDRLLLLAALSMTLARSLDRAGQ